MYLLIGFAALVIALSRAYTEQFIWGTRHGDKLPESCDSSAEYHMFAVIGWVFGVFCLCIACQHIGVQPLIINVILALCCFFIYYYPYTCMYNSMRNQEWFSKGGYHIWIFVIPYPPKWFASIMFYVCIAMLIFLQCNIKQIIALMG